MDFQLKLLQTLDLAFAFGFRTSVQSSTVLFLLLHVHPILEFDLDCSRVFYACRSLDVYPE